MDDLSPRPREISGRDLRYLLTVVLMHAGITLTIDEMIRELHARGVEPAGRPSKTIADSLRWEIGRGRVRRDGRGLYRTGRIPKSTRWWLEQHAARIVRGESVASHERRVRSARGARERRFQNGQAVV